MVRSCDSVTPTLHRPKKTSYVVAGEKPGSKLGVSVRQLTKQEADKLGVPGGLVIENTGGAAAQAGLQPGDVILAINNQRVTTINELKQKLDAAGNRFSLLVQRGDNRLFVPIKLK